VVEKYNANQKPKIDLTRGLVAYFEWIADEYPTTACAMVSRIVPQQASVAVEHTHRYQTMEEIANRLRELGLQPQRIYPMIEAKRVDTISDRTSGSD
jgi:hypothetical protein